MSFRFGFDVYVKETKMEKRDKQSK